MPWVYLDDGFSENRKVLAVGGDAAWLFVCGLCFCNRTLTDGRIPKAIVGRLSDRKNPSRLASKLVAVGLWHDRGDHYEVHDYSEYQPTAESVRTKREQARRAARSRWAGRPPPPSEPLSGEHADRIAERTADSNAETMPRTRESPPSPNPSSSPLPPSAEEEGATHKVKTACEWEARRRLLQRSGDPIQDESAWLAKVARKIEGEHGDRLLGLVSENPALTVGELASEVASVNGNAESKPPYHERYVPAS